MATLYADPEHSLSRRLGPPAREEPEVQVQVGLGVCWTTGMSRACNRGHWHSSSHGTTVLGPGDAAGVAVFRQRLRHQSVQQLREPLATRARSNPLSRHESADSAVARFRIKTPGRARFEKIKIPL